VNVVGSGNDEFAVRTRPLFANPDPGAATP
jgi:hypothetical protein